jgi:hypothetical protein
MGSKRREKHIATSGRPTHCDGLTALITATMDRYTHLLPSDVEALVRRLDVHREWLPTWLPAEYWRTWIAA